MHHASQGAHIKKELLEKMFKELTILGFVAFSATVLLQATLHTLNLHDLHEPTPIGTRARILARVPRTYTYIGTRAAHILWTTSST